MTTRDHPFFHRNVEKWTKFAGEKAQRIRDCSCDHVIIATNRNGELNLLIKDDERSYALHSEEGAQKEADAWFKTLELEDIAVLFVYGVGLGYYYKAAQQWLRENDQRYLVFFEDNPAIIHRLFETEIGTEILNDPQVFLMYYDKIDEDDEEIDALFSNLTFMKYKTSALGKYLEERKKHYQQLKAKIGYYLTFKEGSAIEYINFGQYFFRNFYRNLLGLPKSYLGNGLFEKFKGVPAIICGAGPSLSKNIDQLAELKDRAIIFAGGTSVNTLNVKGILPHFGVQIDPNWYQMTRLIMNQCYEVPFFYRNRFYHDAFKYIHGDRLYITGSGGYDVSNWFEKKLGIEGHNLPEGHNVVNFSLAIATALGCNPIIFVGVDLAYTDDKSYADGVISHPLHDRKQHFQTKNLQEELMIREDIYGKPVYTLWKWIAESIWFARFSLSSPDLIMINATEGGLGLPGIPNRTLKEASEEYLQQQYDISGWIHGEIQEHPMPSTVTRENIEEAVNTMKESLERCMQYCQILSLEFNNQSEKIKNKEAVELSFDDKLMSVLEALNQEIGYAYVLRVFSDMYLEAFAKKVQLLRINTPEDEQKSNLHKAELNTMRYQFLAETARVNISLILKAFEKVVRTPQEIYAKKEIVEEKDDYSFEKGILKIHDPEMGLEIKRTLSEGTYRTHQIDYANGQIQREWTVSDRKLEGPWSYYSDKGILLSRSWFVQGVRQGKAKKYYTNGALYCIQRFKDGLEEGQQIYYYPHGQIKTQISYQKGVLNGDVKLYYPNGQLKREFHYAQGKRQDAERMWSSAGQLTMEVFYKDDNPIGIAREWREDGSLFKEFAYDENSKRLYAKQWDRRGLELHPYKLNKFDYFDQVALQTGTLTNSIEGVISQLGKMLPIISEDKRVGLEDKAVGEMQSDLEVLSKEIENLKHISHEMLVESGVEADASKEQIWKTPSAKKEIEKQLGEATARMGEEVQGLLKLLNETTTLIAKKFAEADKKKSDNEKKQN